MDGCGRDCGDAQCRSYVMLMSYVQSPSRAVLTNWLVECAKRWKQFLDPQLNRSEWTEEEVCSAFPERKD
jgi:hypothetical protein